MLKQTLQFALGVLLGFTGGTAAFGAWTVVEPADGTKLGYNASMACQGDGLELPLGQMKVLKFWNADGELNGSLNIAVGEGMNWSCNLVPNGQWAHTGACFVGIYEPGENDPDESIGGISPRYPARNEIILTPEGYMEEA